MANLVVKFVILLSYFVTNCKCVNLKYESYNSTDLTYYSNGIQIPVHLEDQDPVLQETVNQHFPEMQWMSQLYNHHNWESKLVVLDNQKCFYELSNYLNNLKNGTLWAVKMNDASGRYSSQFFFGNDFWLGSSTLCKELNIEESGDRPPFPVHFYVAKIRININENLTPVTRQLNLGQCLPNSCNPIDVRRLLVQEGSQGTSLNIIDVRSVPGHYSMLEDVRFYIVGGVALFISFIATIATGLEYYLYKKAKVKDIEIPSSNNNNENNNDIDKNTKRVEHLETQSDLKIRIILCFSILGNCKKIIDTSSLSEDSITCLHGLRFFSIAWIILVHTYLEVFAIADNKSLRVVTERSSLYQTISNATFSVDTFFFISGLLVTIGYLKRELGKSNNQRSTKAEVKASITKYLVLIFYRYIRLTPAYLFVLGVNELCLKYLNNESVFSPSLIDHISCDKYWWRNALYINNLFPQYEFCMLWSWYMANDTQFFALAILLLGIGVKNSRCFKWIVAAVFVFLLTSWMTTFAIAIRYNYTARIEEPLALFDELYDKPWLRIGPYLIGMITGYTLIKLKGTLDISRIIAALAWILSIACMSSLVYGLGKNGLVVPISAVYVALGHTAWAISIAWITIACSTGYGGPFNVFLSFRGLVPLSRLTYCAYLLHPVIMIVTSFQLDGPLHLHQGLITIIYCGNVVVSFILAFILSLTFEAPFVGLLKIMSSRQVRKDSPKKQEEPAAT